MTMKSAKAASVRSVKSNKSLRSVSRLSKSKSDDVFEELQPFEDCLPFACQKYDCPFSVFVKKEQQSDDFYKQLKEAEAPVKHKKITISAPYLFTPISQVKFETERKENKTRDSSISEQSDEYSINITAYYNNVNNLCEIYLTKIRHLVPRTLMQIIGYLAASYEYLTKITIHACKIDYYTIYELSKILKMSYITDICLDGSPVSEGNYFILLDYHQTRIKYLSLRRCYINDVVCKEIATRLHYLCPAERSLLLLNLSSNHITDEGAKCLGQALRSNRHLRYLNLADNHISDDGAGFILDSLMEFRLTYDETMSKRKRRLEYLKVRRMCIMKFFNECEAKSSDEFSQYSRKSGTKRKRTSATSVKSKGSVKKENMKKEKQTLSEDFMAKAELLANELLGPFVDPFSPLDTTQKDGYSHCIGNMALCYLNLSYNRLTYFGIKKLVDVLQYQRTAKRINTAGLMKVVIEGNNIPISCVEYQKINELIRLAKSMHHFSGRVSSITGSRQKGRQTRISAMPRLADSEGN